MPSMVSRAGKSLARRRTATGHTRRSVLKSGLAAGAVGLAAPMIVGCGRDTEATRTIKLGFVSPKTGPLAPFAEVDDFAIAGVREIFSAGIENGGKTYKIEVLAKDTQSNPNRAAEVAAELIAEDEVDILLAAATPDTTNPVADQAELAQVPCLTTNCPWQPYFFGRGGDPAVGFEWTYHFFWGLEDVIGAFLALWNASGVAKTVGGLFPNDADGNAWGDAEHGMPGPLAAAGYELVDPGRFQPLSDDFSAQIAAFKEAGAEIVTGVMIPPDFATFWAQAGQQSFAPKVVTVGKALLFPSAIEGLGARGDGLTTEIWWSPDHPFRSSLTGVTCRELADGYAAATGAPWTQPIGFTHALFEVAADVIRRAADIGDKAAVMAAVRATDLDTIVGHVNWSGAPVKNVSKTPLVAGQWQRRDDGFELVITNNETAPQIPVTGELQLL